MLISIRSKYVTRRVVRRRPLPPVVDSPEIRGGAGGDKCRGRRSVDRRGCLAFANRTPPQIRPSLDSEKKGVEQEDRPLQPQIRGLGGPNALVGALTSPPFGQKQARSMGMSGMSTHAHKTRQGRARAWVWVVGSRGLRTRESDKGARRKKRKQKQQKFRTPGRCCVSRRLWFLDGCREIEEGSAGQRQEETINKKQSKENKTASGR